jgi:FkbM family methyltransferase
MLNLRTVLSPLLSEANKRRIQQLLLGYHSFAPSFSSAGEDMILRHILGSDKTQGFYVDIGAVHPTLFSNTYFFYSYGWRGLNVEACPGSKEIFDKVRPRDINLEIGVARESGNLTYYVVDEASTMNSFSIEFLRHLGIEDSVKRTISVAVRPLSEIFDQYLPENLKIDFMSVDVEGKDLEVLESNNWSQYRPTLVVVEDAAQKTEDSDIVSFMQLHEYEICARNVIVLGKVTEYFFIDRNSHLFLP